MLTASELEAELRALRGRIDRLQPQLSQNPHRFHEEKSELRAFVDSLIERAFGRTPTTARAFCAPQGDAGGSHVRQGGRSIPVERR